MNELLSHNKTRQIAHPRSIAFGLARQLTRASYPAIAREFQRKDHTTAINGVRRSWELLSRYPEYEEKRHAIIRSLQRGDDPSPG